MPEVTPEQWAAAQAQGFQPDVSQQQLLDTWNKARNVEQAQKAVDAQLRMLGILRVKAAIEKGVDPAAATYSNLHLLSPAGSKNFSTTMQNLRPVPPPYATNFPGMGQAVIAPTRQGQTVHFPPSRAMDERRAKQDADTKGFIDAINAGEDTMSAYQKFPMATGPMVNALTRGQETIKMTPGGGFEFIRESGVKKPGAAADVPTTANRTKLQQDLYSHDAAIETLDHLTKNMNESDFGVRGVAKDLWAKVGGQLGAQVDPNSLDARNSLRLLRASLYKSFRSDANIAEPERKQIEQMFPSEGIIESLPDALGKLQAVRRKLGVESKRAAERLGVKAPKWALDIGDVATMVRKKIQDGTMSEDQGVKTIMDWQKTGNLPQ